MKLITILLPRVVIFLYERTLMKERSQIRLDYLISVRLKPDESGSADAWTGAIHIEKRSILFTSFN